MTKTIKMFKGKVPSDDYAWALAMTDSERIALAMQLTCDLWRAAHGGDFPTMDRGRIIRVK